MKIYVGERRLTILRVFATQSSPSVIHCLLQHASRTRILEMETAGGDLTKRKTATRLNLDEKLEIIRLHDETNPGVCRTQTQLADMFEVPIHPVIL